MDLRSAETRTLDVDGVRLGSGQLEATFQTTLLVCGTSAPSQWSPSDSFRLIVDRGESWEAAAVERGYQMRETWR